MTAHAPAHAKPHHHGHHLPDPGHAHHEHHHEHELAFCRKYIFSTDYNWIGVQYTVTALLFLFFGLSLMMVMRWQLAYPGQPIPFIGKWLSTTIADNGILSGDGY